MKLGEIFLQLGIKGDTKKLDKSIEQMEKADKVSEKLTKDIAKQNTEVNKNNQAWVGAAKGIGAFIAGATIAYKVVDRMVTSLAQANQKLITFQRTTGISFSSLNKYASANAAVNMNSSIEGTAQTMQRLAQNLWDIRMGRGDISPYQELAFVGGKAFNPMGMSVEQLIENVREAIKGVDDLQATNIIQRMGFAPDDLMMLRMSREEFEKINDLFLSPKQREQLNKYGLELKKINLSFEKMKQSIIIDLARPFIKVATIVERLANLLYKGIIKPIQVGFKAATNLISNMANGVKSLTKALISTFSILKPIFSILKMIGEIIWLPIEDVITYLTGGDSLTGRALEGLANIADRIKDSLTFNFQPPAWVQKVMDWFNRDQVQPNANGEYMSYFGDAPQNMTPINTNNLGGQSNNINTSNNFSISTNQPIETIASSLINKFTPTQVQYSTIAI